MSFLKKIIILATIIFLVLFFFYTAIQHSNKINNQLSDQGDQIFHVNTIRKIYQNRFYLGDRNRMPLYQHFQALFYKEGMSNEAFFSQAKLVNIVLSIILGFVIFFVALRFLKKLSSITFSLIIIFTLFLPKAPYLQPEILYFTLSFISFLFLLQTIRQPKILLGFCSGAILAIAYLTKASALLSFILFVSFQTSITLAKLIKLIIKKKSIRNLGLSKTKISKIFLATLTFVATFLIILSPYLYENKKMFGNYFFNYGTNICFWLDGWKDLQQETGEYKKLSAWLSLPKHQRPGPFKYLKEHTAGDILKRELEGLAFNIWLTNRSYAGLSITFLLVYLLFTIYSTFSNKLIKRSFKDIILKNLPVFIFSLTYICLYLLTSFWYWEIGSGARFMLAVYIPSLFLVFYVLDNLKQDMHQKTLRIFHIVILLLLILTIKTVLLPLMFTRPSYH